jgi:hypothetical protein
MRVLFSCGLVACSAFLVGALPAQRTWQVADHQEFTAALVAAAPGDVIQLAPSGVFQSFTLTKGLTLRGPAAIGGNHLDSGRRSVTVPDGQVAQFVDIAFRTDPTYPPFTPDQGTVEVSGSARFDHCTIAGSMLTAALRLQGANVLVQHCTITGYASSAGIVAVDSTVSIHDSSVAGSSGFRSFYYSSGAAPGISCSGSGSLHVSMSTVLGGNGNYHPSYGNWPPATGLVTNVPAWISDCTVQGGSTSGPNPGGDALSATAATHARCSFVGGAGTPPGQAIVGDAELDPTLLGASSSGPLLMGQEIVLRLLADRPLVPVAILVTVGVRSPGRYAAVTQPLWLGESTFFLAAGATSGSAEFQLLLQIPLDPTLANVSCDFLGLRAGGAGVQLAPLTGGVLR